MEVVRSYDIARLVLGYLRDNKLEKAAKIFCKTSPYLVEEYDLLQKGFWPVSLRHDQLPDMIREYCEIQSEVVQFIDSLVEQNRFHIPKHGSLLAKVTFLIKFIKDSVLENTTKCQGTKRRKSTHVDNQEPVEATQEKDLPGFSPPVKKKRRVSSTFLCLANNRIKCMDISSDESSIFGPVGASSSNNFPGKIRMKEQAKETSTANVSSKVDDHSPPGEEKTNVPVPSIPVIAEALLEHKEFQSKLVENINKVLSSAPSSAQKNVENKHPTIEKPSDDIALQFEEMIKSILDETEKDPTFNDLVENIVLSNNVPESETVPQSETVPVNQATQFSPPDGYPNLEANTDVFPADESSIKDRLRPRKANTSTAEAPKEDLVNDTLNTPCKAVVSASDAKLGSSANDTSSSSSKLIVVKSSETIATSTPLISDSFLSQLGDNILIDMSTGQTIPFLMSSDMNTFFLNTSSGGPVSQDLQLGKIIDSKNLQTMNIMPNDIASMPIAKKAIVEENLVVKKGIVEENLATCASSSKSSTVPAVIAMPVASIPSASSKSSAVPVVVEMPAVNVPSISTKSSNVHTVVEIPAVNVPSGSGAITTASRRPVSAQAKTIQDNSTPSVSVPPTGLLRSLSTPRRRSSHIRALDFTSPKPQSEVKVSTLPPFQRNIVSVATTETLPKPGALSNTTTESIATDARTFANPLAVINESSNSSSNNGFIKTGSDITVIHHSISETPKRKSQGRQSCARVLSRSGSEEADTSSKPKKKLPKKETTRKATVETEAKKKPKRTYRKQNEVQPTPVKIDIPSHENAMEEWNRLRAISSGQWDQHLREVCASEQAANPPPPSARKRRRKGKLLRKQKALNALASAVQDTGDSKRTEAERSPEKSSTKKALIEFKISTPLKLGKSPGKNKSKTTEALREEVQTAVQQPAVSAFSEMLPGKSEQTVPTAIKLLQHESKIPDPSKFTKALLESRSHNIGLLLDTPLKLDTAGVPATPGFLIPDSSVTPMVRMPLRAQISMCKNPDLPTPTYAITPGAGIPIFDKDTPRSAACQTDYSSGGSYYRPDESEDLDKHFDALLSDRRKSEREKPLAMTMAELKDVLQEDSSNQTVVTAINRSVEVQVPVVDFPKVLERISSPPKLAALPHYTLTEGLPTDVSTPSFVSESSSSDSSSSDNSSSSSSSSSKSESDSDSKTTSKENNDSDLSWNQSDLEELAKKRGKSAEGLLNNKGEVRYPIRTWLTPKKAEKSDTRNAPPEKVDKQLEDVVDEVKSNPVSQDTQVKQLESLEQKRLRMKNKLDKDFSAIEPKRSHAGALKKAKLKTKPTAVHFKKAMLMDSTKAATTQSTKTAATQSTKAVTTQSTEAATSQSTKAATTQSTKAAATQSAKAATTQSTKAATTQSTKAAATQSTKTATTHSTKAVTAQKPKAGTSQRTKAETAHRTKPEISNVDTAKIDVMKALNLSLKESNAPESPGFSEDEEFPKLRVDEDSKDSAESMEVRKAAYALTKLKSSRECVTTKDIQPATTEPQKKVTKPTNPPSKGHPKKKAIESAVVENVPHKPVTRRDAKNVQKKHKVTGDATGRLVKDKVTRGIDLDVATSRAVAGDNFTGRSTDFQSNIFNAEEGETIIVIETEMPQSVDVPAYEIFQTSTSVTADRQPLPSKRDANPQASVESTPVQQEYIDPYNKCHMTSIGDSDSNRFKHVVYNARESRISCQSLQSGENLSSMLMSVIINGNVHQIQVTDEVELLSQLPATTRDKNSTKGARHKSSTQPMLKEKPQLPTCRRVSREQTEMYDVVGPAKDTGAAQIQPKINIRYKQNSTSKERGKLKTEAATSKVSRSSPTKPKASELKDQKEAVVPKPVTREPTPPTPSGTETKAPNLKNDDIFAVLSHIHGN